MRTDDLKPGSWACVTFDGFKTHFVPSELAGDLVADIEGRGGRTMEVMETDHGGADLPGMVSAGRPWEDIQLGGFKLGFPSTDLEHFLGELTRSPVRRFASGREYHKIHGWLHCVVLTPEQRVAAMEAMEAILPEVRRRAEEEDKKLERALERINADKVRVVRPRPMPGKGEPEGGWN